jgi:hypothetical protein
MRGGTLSVEPRRVKESVFGMEASLADHVWEIEDLLKLID